MNEATRTVAVLLGGEAGALTRKAIELALSGDIAALRLCLDRIIAPQREQPVAFAMPMVGSAADLAAAMTALAAAAAAGAVAPEAAASLAQMLEAHARVIASTARLEAERLAARQAEIGARMELRVCVVMAHHLSDFRAAGEIDWQIKEPVAEMLRLGQAAGQTLATIPDTPELVEADRAFLAAHPLPLVREPHPLGTRMVELWDPLSRYLDEPGTLHRLDRRLAERAASGEP